MPASPFYDQFGFSADPLESTNAENEPRLVEYFVPPPYFEAVMGDPAVPQSHVVLAPRGSGKTAQRRMIEQQSAERNDFLCVTYDASEQPPGFAVDQATWTFHLNQICRRILVGLLMFIEEDRWGIESLTDHQRKLLKFQLNRFLGPLSTQEFEWAVRGIKTFGDKASDFWHKYGGPAAAAITILLRKAGLDGVAVPGELAERLTQDESTRYHYENLLKIVQALGLSSTYVLVDKVDEASVTEGNAAATFEFIRPLLTDLPTLEAPGVAFKFFLWDKIREAYLERGGRPDRIQILSLSWTADELMAMMRERLSTYSAGAVTSMNQLLVSGSGVDLHSLVAYIGSGSPRDMIRCAKAIVNEATRFGTATEVSDQAVWRGIQLFAEQRTSELFANYLPDLQKVGQPTFTVNQLANDIFHISTQAARNKVQNWTNTGIVSKIGELPNPGNRPLHLYGIVDLRVAITAATATDVRLALDNYAVECPACVHLVVTGESSVGCPNCGNQFQFTSGRSLLDICRLR